MNDDWRPQVDFRADGIDDALLDRLDAHELEDDLSDAYHDRVIVTRDETTVFKASSATSPFSFLGVGR